jgi:hypothetical protein
MTASALSSNAIRGTFRALAPLEAIVYCAYGDESRDETGDRVYVVAAVFGHKDEWNAITEPWRARLEGKVFHASDCECGHGEFEGIEKAERLSLYRALTKLLASSPLLGHSVAINVAEYRAAFPNEFEDAPYLWAFGDVLQSVADLTSVAIPSGNLEEVTFDQNEEIEHNASLLYDFFRRQKPHGEFLADKVSFACRRTVGIQIADLVAREGMKRLDQIITGTPPYVRGSFNALNASKRFAFITVGQKEFIDKKAQLEQMQVPNSDLESYRRWIDEKRLQDCLTNRIEHMKIVAKACDHKASPKRK